MLYWDSVLIGGIYHLSSMNFLTQSLKNPWWLTVAVNAAVIVGVLVYKITSGTVDFQYLHLIIDYHFGFAKRALMGALVSLFLPAVPMWFVFVLGGAAIAVTAGLFCLVFKRTFGFADANLPVFVFMFGSPLFLKNFATAVGYFDIYGCIFALVMLLFPARSFGYVVIAGLGCVVLVVLHHIHFLLYVPTIGVIVAIRYYFVRGFTSANLIGAALMTALITATFIVCQFNGNVPVPIETLIAHMKTRTAAGNFYLNPDVIEIWYRPIESDISRTHNTIVQNLTRVPAYFVLAALHWPLIRYFTELVRSRAEQWHRKLIVAGIVLVSVGYLIIFAVVFDYARWVSAWAVCMFLIMHAVKTLPAGREPAPIDPNDKTNGVLAWIVTFVPRVGVTRPF